MGVLRIVTDERQRLLPSASVLFVSKASLTSGVINSYNLRKRIEIVKDTRNVNKHDMKFNGSTPAMKVDPETFVSGFPPCRRTNANPKSRKLSRTEWPVRRSRLSGLRWDSSTSYFDRRQWDTSDKMHK